MGKGKGRISNEISKVQKGFVMLNLITTNITEGKSVLRQCQLKLGIKSRIKSNKFFFLL
jgi:ribosomal protein L16/L10AE